MRKKSGFIVAGIIGMLLFSACGKQPPEESNISSSAVTNEKSNSVEEKLSGAAVGDSVYFGSYEQDGNLDNGNEEIEWIVLDEQEGSLLLLSKNALDEIPYVEKSAESTAFTWSDSYLRTWLNEEFWKTAFSEREQDFICMTKCCNLRDEKWNSENGEDTLDKVFILSASEFSQYLPDGSDWQAQITTYGHKSKLSGQTRYWLRCNSIGYEGRCMEGGNVQKDTDEMLNPSKTDSIAVRPAIWVNKNGDASFQHTMGENVQARLTQVGDVLPYANLDWQVLAIEDDRLLLITKKCLAGSEMSYNSNENNPNWEASTARAWLNQEFLQTQFDEESRSKLLLTKNVNENSADTEDYVFLLSAEEAERYFYTSEERWAYLSDAKTADWMLRSTTSERAQYVTFQGLLQEQNIFDGMAYLRPAVWVQDEDLLLYTTRGESDRKGVLYSILNKDDVPAGETENTQNEEKNNRILMSDCVFETGAFASWPTVLGSKYYRRDIQSITFLDNFDTMLNTAWDVSENQDRSIMAWVVFDEATEYYDLYIASENTIVADSCRDLFFAYHNVTSIAFNGCFSTSGTDSLYRMFAEDSKLSDLDVSFFDTSEVNNMAEAFSGCGELTEIDVSSWNTGKVIDYSEMFYCCSGLQNLELDGWQTESASDMSKMFYHCRQLNSLGSGNFNVPEYAESGDMYELTPLE